MPSNQVYTLIDKIWVAETKDIEIDYSMYFNITDDGILSLKPEYRDATNKDTYINDISDNGVNKKGSKYDELPEDLTIPFIVNNKAVL